MKQYYCILQKAIFTLTLFLSPGIFVMAQELKLETNWWQPDGPINAFAYDSIKNIVVLKKLRPAIRSL